MVDEVKEVTEKVADLDVKGDAQEDDGTEVDPWDVKGKVDYGKLIKKFGCQAITDEQVTRIERCTGMKAQYQEKTDSHASQVPRKPNRSKGLRDQETKGPK